MTIIKVSTSIFSRLRSIAKAVAQASNDDTIQLPQGAFDETLHFDTSVVINGINAKRTILNGTIYIPANCSVTFRNVTIQPRAQIYIEGHATFQNCVLEGKEVKILVSVNGGHATLQHCILSNAQEVAIYSLNQSQLFIDHCQFLNNQYMHVLSDQSVSEIKHSSFEGGRNALWIKNQSTAQCEGITAKNQSGTQIIVQQSTFHDQHSQYTNSDGNGLYAISQSAVILSRTLFSHHKLPQIWLQESTLEASHCHLMDGTETAMMLAKQSSATCHHCLFERQRIAHIQVIDQSRLHMEQCQLIESAGVGVQVKDASIVNFWDTTFSANALAQLFISTKAIASLKNCQLLDGMQVGLMLEKSAQCTLVQCQVNRHQQTAITVTNAQLVVIGCDLIGNDGNGLLALNDAHVTIEKSQFRDNKMPHIASKLYAELHVSHSKFIYGKTFYGTANVQATFQHCTMTNSNGVQLDLSNQCAVELQNCRIERGTSNAIKVYENSRLHMEHCQIAHHNMPQVVINDSSIICRDSEIYAGTRNAFIIENHSEALILDSFISKHGYTQIWVDEESLVELQSTQLTDGEESDLYVQNHSAVYLRGCLIRNSLFQYNIQAVEYGKIIIMQSSIENHLGDSFYQDKQSTICDNMDEVDY